MTTETEFEIVRIAPAGDAALLVEFPQHIDPRINARAIAMAEQLRRRCGSAVRDVVVGYATLTVYFDPLIVDTTWMEAEVYEAAANLPDPGGSSSSALEVPVCYGGEYGPDISEVARFGNCTEDEVVRLHSSIAYRVYLVGFVPGFAYMASVDPRIAAPRRPAPRAIVTPGSVAIAGRQTGIYPAATPGGWNIIGRSPARPYDPKRSDPFLFHAGDTVQFRPIPPHVYNELV